MIRILLIIIIACIGLVSCKNEKVYTPKPRMYPRVIYPEKEYDDFVYKACNFTFQKPTYATIKTGINFFEEEAKDPCWFDLEIKELNSTLHFSYNRIEGKNTLEKLVVDAFKIVERHNAKAEYRGETIVENKNGVKGLLFNIEGPVASPVNFFLTDTTRHFLRASLYFNNAVNPDSISPILDFVNEDIDKILATFKWND